MTNGKPHSLTQAPTFTLKDVEMFTFIKPDTFICNRKPQKMTLTVFFYLNKNNYTHTKYFHSLLYTSQFENQLGGKSDDRKKKPLSVTSQHTDVTHNTVAKGLQMSQWLYSSLRLLVGFPLLLILMKIKLKKPFSSRGKTLDDTNSSAETHFVDFSLQFLYKLSIKGLC